MFEISNIYEVDLMREKISGAQLPNYAANVKDDFPGGDKFKDWDIPNFSCFKFMIITPKKKLAQQSVLNVNWVKHAYFFRSSQKLGANPF